MINKHHYDEIEAEVLLSYNQKYKGLYGNVSIQLPLFDMNDNRFIQYESFFSSCHEFLIEGSVEFKKRSHKKSHLHIVECYKVILESRAYELKWTLEKLEKGSWPYIHVYEYSCIVWWINLLEDFIKELGVRGVNEEDEKQASVIDSAYSWDDIDFRDEFVYFQVRSNPRSEVRIPSSLKLLNSIKSDYFQRHFPDTIFKLVFDGERIKLDTKNGFDLENLLRAESESINSFLRGASNDGRRLEGENVDIRPMENRDLSKITEKNEFIRAAALLTNKEDLIYSLKENNNGKEESSIILEFSRKNFNYVVVENENRERSGLLFITNSDTESIVPKVKGLLESEEKNKRMLIKEKKFDSSSWTHDKVFIVRLYHSKIESYRNRILHYLCLFG